METSPHDEVGPVGVTVFLPPVGHGGTSVAVDGDVGPRMGRTEGRRLHSPSTENLALPRKDGSTGNWTWGSSLGPEGRMTEERGGVGTRKE